MSLARARVTHWLKLYDFLLFKSWKDTTTCKDQVSPVTKHNPHFLGDYKPYVPIKYTILQHPNTPLTKSETTAVYEILHFFW